MKQSVATKKTVGKITGLFVILTLYFITFSYYGSAIVESIILPNEKFEEGTVIGSENVSNKSQLAAVRTLNEKVTQWHEQTTLTFSYMEKTATIETSLIEFQVEKSVEEAVSGQKNELKATVSKERLQEMLIEKFPALNSTALNLDLLASDISDIGDYLKTGESLIDLTLYLPEEKTATVVAEILQGDINGEIADLVQKHPKIAIKKNSVFSFNQWKESIHYGNLNEKSTNKVSSALYRVVLQTNFTIMEKNQGIKHPSYIQLGYEARVNPEKDQDFVFMNANSADYIIEWKEQDGKLAVQLKGIPFYYSYQTAFKNKKILKPKTILHFTPALEYGSMRVERFGESGEMIDVYRNTLENTKLFKKEKIAEDFYPPVHQIELHSSQDPPPPPPPPEPIEEEEPSSPETEGGQEQPAEEAESETKANENKDEGDSRENSN